MGNEIEKEIFRIKQVSKWQKKIIMRFTYFVMFFHLILYVLFRNNLIIILSLLYLVILLMLRVIIDKFAEDKLELLIKNRNGRLNE